MVICSCSVLGWVCVGNGYCRINSMATTVTVQIWVGFSIEESSPLPKKLYCQCWGVKLSSIFNIHTYPSLTLSSIHTTILMIPLFHVCNLIRRWPRLLLPPNPSPLSPPHRHHTIRSGSLSSTTATYPSTMWLRSGRLCSYHGRRQDHLQTKLNHGRFESQTNHRQTPTHRWSTVGITQKEGEGVSMDDALCCRRRRFGFAGNQMGLHSRVNTTKFVRKSSGLVGN